jgi:hypothetical protein
MFEAAENFKLFEKILLILMFASLDVVFDGHRTWHILSFVHLSEPAFTNKFKQLYFSLLDDKLKVSPFF